jgi:hypothetical protein
MEVMDHPTSDRFPYRVLHDATDIARYPPLTFRVPGHDDNFEALSSDGIFFVSGPILL